MTKKYRIVTPRERADRKWVTRFYGYCLHGDPPVEDPGMINYMLKESAREIEEPRPSSFSRFISWLHRWF